MTIKLKGESEQNLPNSEDLEAEDLLAFVDTLFDKKRNTGVPTGLTKLDELVGGLRSSNLVVLGGATGMGKSILGLSILINLAKSGHNVAYFDLENGREESYKRIVCGWYDRPSGWFDDSENAMDTAGMISDVEERLTYFGFEDVDAWTKGEKDERRYKFICRLIRAMAQDRNKNVRFFLIDPLQALETHDNPHANQNQQGKIIRVFKELAQELNITIIVCHHIRKSTSSAGNWTSDISDVGDVKYRVPNIEDLKGSAKIADFAQMVWVIVRMKDSEYERDRVRTLFRVLKNRSGKSGDFFLRFDEGCLKFKDWSEHMGGGVWK